MGYISRQRNTKNSRDLVGNSEGREKQQGNTVHGETCKLHHQLPNEGSLNRSSGTHNHSFYCRASAAGLRSATLMVIDGALSVRAKCLSYTAGRSPASKPRHHVKTHRVQQSQPSEEIKCHRAGPLRYCKFSMLCFLMCEYPESQPRDRGGKKASLKFLHLSPFSLMHVELQINGASHQIRDGAVP